MDNVPVRVSEQITNKQARPDDRKSKRRIRRKRTLVTVLAALLAIGAMLTAFLILRNSSTSATIDSGKYQAVFFTNGQVYFGKLETLNDEYMRLRNIYYLQSTASTGENLQQPSAQTDDVQLIKLGDEIHGPEDEMLISKDQILFFENLKTDGRVSQSINNYTKN